MDRSSEVPPGQAEQDASADPLREALGALLTPGDGGPVTAGDLADVLWIARLSGLGPPPAAPAAPGSDG
ncbi:hypothetical protein ACFXAF_34160, partial [Kitasatospora sp. NPDC059463]|uniref:hypothetical protein n=1 Tax=Kitasatospora sp. NPDC059463 TaxID=3346842 RepID=UPI0036999054